MANVLRVRNLSVEIAADEGTIKAVDGVSFRVPQGKTVALVGESGSGKSMIAQSIMGILPEVASVTAGEMLFFDPEMDGHFVDLTTLAPKGKEYRKIRGARVSIIFQEPMTALSPLHTVGNQIGESLLLHAKLGTQIAASLEMTKKMNPALAREVTADMLRLVGFPDPAKAIDTYPFELSGGLRQRAVIAMALVCRPALVIADEPTTALDVTIQAQILKLLKDLQAEMGMAILMITHDLGVVANMADEVVVLYRGKVMESGLISDIFEDPRHPYLKALLQAVPRFDMAPGERLTPIREIKADATALAAFKQPWPAGADAAGPMLKVEGLEKSFTIRKSGLFNKTPKVAVKAVDDVSFFVPRGHCLGLVGESGCGKTTTSKMIMRALSADAGRVLFNDRGKIVDVLTLQGQELFAFRRKVQFMFQDPFSSLNPRMTVLDIIAEPFLIHGIGTEAERVERVRELMRLVGLDPRFLRRYPHSFSGGQRQRIGIARAIALMPDLIICDEPVSALDVSVQAQVLNLLKDLQQQLGLTYIFISHNLAVIDYMADEIAVMCRGRLVEQAPRQALFANPIHPYTQALLSAVPKPELGARLDLTALMEGKASEPHLWPAPFTVDEAHAHRLVEVEPEHFVRVFDDARPEELVA